MLNNIYKGNTVAFTAIPTVDGTPQALEGTTVGFILKKDMNDSDEQALIEKTVPDGKFILSSEDTSIPVGTYWYEFRWFVVDAVYTLEMGFVNIINTVYD
jgi:hypothetical protein